MPIYTCIVLCCNWQETFSLCDELVNDLHFLLLFMIPKNRENEKKEYHFDKKRPIEMFGRFLSGQYCVMGIAPVV